MPLDNNISNNKLDALKFLLKAQCYESNENKHFANFCYNECLKKDPTCVEAFFRLIECYLIPA